MRESPALKIIEILEDRGAKTSYFDPFVPKIPITREHLALAGRESEDWREDLTGDFDATLIVTDHDGVDYGALLRNAALLVDTRNACRKAGFTSDLLVLA
jgi:UDP-N-acetyl-D-glucosamine dehydrogenase